MNLFQKLDLIKKRENVFKQPLHSILKIMTFSKQILRHQKEGDFKQGAQ